MGQRHILLRYWYAHPLASVSSTFPHYLFTTILYHIKININNTKLSFILLICSAEKNEWTFVIPEGDRPLSPRDKLSSCTIGNKVSTRLPSFHYTTPFFIQLFYPSSLYFSLSEQIYIIGGFGPRVKKTTEEGGGNEEKDDEGEDDEDDEMEEGDEGERKGAKVPEFDWFDDVLVFDTGIYFPQTLFSPSLFLPPFSFFSALFCRIEDMGDTYNHWYQALSSLCCRPLCTRRQAHLLVWRT